MGVRSCLVGILHCSSELERKRQDALVLEKGKGQ